MTATALLEYAAPRADVGKVATATGSVLSRTYNRSRLFKAMSATRQPTVRRPITFEDRIAASGAAIEKVIRRSASHLGRAATSKLVARVRQMFDPAEWERDQPMPSRASADVALRAVATLAGNPSLGVASDGNLTAFWQQQDRSLIVEGLPSGRVKWAMVIERERDFVRVHGDNDTIATMIGAIKKPA